MGYHCFTTQIIGKDGVLDIPRLDKFTKDVKLNDPYAVVSIVGAQSSGKSTLMNHLFGTDFQEMNTNGRRSQTTNGIWLAKAKNIEPCTLVMDLEGTDGKERGVDDTSFEKQSALFALAVSDVVLINMWCHDIGREHAGNRPLLKTIFQVLMRLFDPHKKTMLFVIRDKTKTPFKNLVADLREDVQQIWDGVRKPQAHTDTPLSDFFNIQFEALSNYEENPDLFKDQVSTLRNWFRESIGHAGPSGNQHGVVPASGFSYSTNEIWKRIKEDKDLDLPTHKVMVATVRCGQISSEKVASFTADQEWKHFKETVQNDYVPGFGKKISTLLHRCLSEYDMESIYYDEGVRTSKKQQLESEISLLVYPAYQSLMRHLRTGTLKAFKEYFHKALEKQEFHDAARDCTQSFLHKFNKGCEDATIDQVKCDPANFKNKLKHDINAHVESVRAAKLADLCGTYERKLTRALAEPVQELLGSAECNTWRDIRMLLGHETKAAVADLKSALSAFGLDEATEKELLSRLENHGRSVVESKAKEEAASVSIRMKDRFSILFNTPKLWAGNEDIEAITVTSRSECLMILWIMSAIRLDGDGDNFEKFCSQLDEGPGTTDTSNQFDPLTSISQKKILEEKTLISPVKCKSLWSKFLVEAEYIVAPAKAAQEAKKKDNKKFWIQTATAGGTTAAVGTSAIVSICHNLLGNDETNT